MLKVFKEGQLAPLDLLPSSWRPAPAHEDEENYHDGGHDDDEDDDKVEEKEEEEEEDEDKKGVWDMGNTHWVCSVIC